MTKQLKYDQVKLQTAWNSYVQTYPLAYSAHNETIDKKQCLPSIDKPCNMTDDHKYKDEITIPA